MQKKLKILITTVCFISSIVEIKAQVPVFNEISSEIGLNYIYPGNDFQMAGGGVMIIDVNNDGWEDFFQSGGVFDSKLWINKRGTFVDGTTEYGLDVLKGYFIQGAVSADYNNDGFQDFFIANYGIGMSRGDKKSPALLKNIHGKRFEIIRMDSVVGPGNFASACWGDINQDGFPDLYLTNYIASMGGISDSNGVEIGYDPFCFENKLLLNLAGKDFRECAKEYGINDAGCGLAASFTDVDNDGDQDLLLLNDFGEWTNSGNKFFRNDYPLTKFTDVSEENGFAHLMYGMGIGQGDYDQDGDLDYYTTNIGSNCLFQNTNGQLVDVAKEMNLDLKFVRDSIRGTSWTALFFDVDFDGDLDLYVSKGNVATLVPKTVISDPNKFFVNENGIYIDRSTESGLADILSHRGSALLDFDHDGDLDLISSVVKLPWSAFAKKDQKLKFYRNDTPHGNWIGIKLIGEKEINKDCFGCKVLFENDSTKMLREVDGGSGQASQSSRILYYGLGNKLFLKKATVLWLGGKKLTLEDLKAGYVYEVYSNGKIKCVK